jgi:ferredoxin-type protein NapH
MQQGLKSVYKSPWSNRAVPAWILCAFLLSFYCVLYFTEWITPFARLIGLPSKWTLYGLLYTLAIMIGGIFFLKKNGNNLYHRWRTISLILVQVILAFALPLAMPVFGAKEYYLSYLWPLKIEYFYPSVIFEYPAPFIIYSFLGSLVMVPLLAFFLGKRFYCSWVCGCGGLAETFGDPFRHLSNKSTLAWRIEQVTIYSVLFLSLSTTAIVIANWGIGQKYPLFSHYAFKVQGFYGFWIGAILSGVIGVGLYPLMGTRVWCRFACPMAALLGLIQKFGRFRITVKKDMCISCGNCSTHCEMGIDVRKYAQANQSFKRASCVGCGVCAHVCPRGVLKLENKWDWATSNPGNSIIDL